MMPAFILLLPQEAYLLFLLSRLRRGAEHDLNLTRGGRRAVATVRSILLQPRQRSVTGKALRKTARRVGRFRATLYRCLRSRMHSELGYLSGDGRILGVAELCADRSGGLLLCHTRVGRTQQTPPRFDRVVSLELELDDWSAGHERRKSLKEVLLSMLSLD